MASIRDGHHWVWLSAREAGEVINRARNTAAKYLDQLVRLGFLVREKLGEAQQFGRNRCWYYRPGPECPDFLLGKPVRTKGHLHEANTRPGALLKILSDLQKPLQNPPTKTGAQALKNNSPNSPTPIGPSQAPTRPRTA